MSLVRKELRELAPRILSFAVVLFVVVAFSFAQAGLMYLRADSSPLSEIARDLAEHPTIVFGPFVPACFGFWLWAVWVGFDALSSEAAQGTWSFLRTRPMSLARFMGAKFALRAALVAAPWMALCGGSVALLLWQPGAEDRAVGMAWARLQWVATSPPFAGPLLAATLLAVGLAPLAVAVLVSSCTGHRGIALGLATLLGSAPLAIAIYLWLPLVEDQPGFVVPSRGVVILSAAATVLLTLAAVRVGTLRQPGLRV